MMHCPSCGTRCPVNDSKKASHHVWRQYRCNCGLSFHTHEKIIKQYENGKPGRESPRNKLMAAFLENKYPKARMIIEGRSTKVETPEIPKPTNGWFRQ